MRSITIYIFIVISIFSKSTFGNSPLLSPYNQIVDEFISLGVDVQKNSENPLMAKLLQEMLEKKLQEFENFLFLKGIEREKVMEILMSIYEEIGIASQKFINEKSKNQRKIDLNAKEEIELIYNSPPECPELFVPYVDGDYNFCVFHIADKAISKNFSDYCYYMKNGYLGFSWSTAANKYNYSCPKEMRAAPNGHGTQYCLFEQMKFPTDAEPHCDAANGYIGYKWQRLKLEM